MPDDAKMSQEEEPEDLEDHKNKEIQTEKQKATERENGKVDDESSSIPTDLREAEVSQLNLRPILSTVLLLLLTVISVMVYLK